jgi:hypothetical protein
MNIDKAQKAYDKRIKAMEGRSKRFMDTGSYCIGISFSPRPPASKTSRFKGVLTKRRSKTGQVAIGSW